MMPALDHSRPSSAFTVLELLAVVALVGILVVLATANYPALIARAQEARCMANLRTIHLGLTQYLNDHDSVWPQGPSPEDETVWSRFWLDTLARYDVTEKVWQCPSLRSMLLAGGMPEQERPRLHYIPTMFSAAKGIAYRWPTQPWLIERGDAHGKGALICFPDGSIKPFSKVLAEQGIR